MEIDFPPINNRIYNKNNYYYPHPYDDDCYWNWYPKKTSPKSAWRSKKQILPYQVRMYKTWKYNRRTQWK